MGKLAILVALSKGAYRLYELAFQYSRQRSKEGGNYQTRRPTPKMRNGRQVHDVEAGKGEKY